MNKQKSTTLVIGEGPTEFYFLNSLKDDYRALQNIKPDTPKNTSLHDLQHSIEDAISLGFNRIYCLIDMDTKRKDAKSMRDYLRLKKKYHGLHIVKPKHGIDSFVKFFETDRCTELFFLYYFKYTTQEFSTSDDIEILLYKECGYKKNLKFFKGHPLHHFFCKQGGCFQTAIANANKSLRDVAERGHTYSEMGILFEDLLGFHN
ncbi:MAG: RloB domain-containing protein [Lepagella sp.]